MASITGINLKDITFTHHADNFSGTQLTLPNTVNGGNFGVDDDSICVETNGSGDYQTLSGTRQYTIDRTTANAHKIVFTDARTNENIRIRFIGLLA